MNPELKQRIDVAINKAEKAAEEWLKGNEHQVEKKIYQMLDKKLEDIIAKAIGFNYHWGKWEVDHCNGRAGESFVGDWIKQNAKEAVAKWLKEQIESLPNLPVQATKELKKDYLEELKGQIQEALGRKAIEHAEKIVSKIIGEDFKYD